MILREYQSEILNIMRTIQPGRYLIQMATGLGKTVCFTEYINKLPLGMKVLILAHREELINQPVKYIKCSTGIEQANNTSNGENIIAASVQSLVKRLDKFPKNYFDVIITDEAHHSPAKTYQKIYNYFDFKIHFGFTATPNRFDNVRLDSTYDKIVYEKPLLWGIQNGFLSNVICKRFYINYDLKRVKTVNGDFQLKALDEVVNEIENNKQIADIYHKHAIGSTIIFGVSVSHCEAIQKEIPGSVVVSAKTKNRDQIIINFISGKIKCLINCMVFTEGVDIPRVETIIIARPTKNISLYTQMIGRGLRLHIDKKELLLIDCVGASELNLCTAPSLLGINMPERNKQLGEDREIQGNLFDLPEKISNTFDKPEYWIINYKMVDLWGKGLGFNFHGINLYKLPNGTFTLRFPKVDIKIDAPNELGIVNFKGKEVKFQRLLDQLYTWLNNNHQKSKYIWDISLMKKWGKKLASEKQIDLVRRFCPEFNIQGLTKIQAAQILNRNFNK